VGGWMVGGWVVGGWVGELGGWGGWVGVAVVNDASISCPHV
jgi:hypothetical protein